MKPTPDPTPEFARGYVAASDIYPTAEEDVQYTESDAVNLCPNRHSDPSPSCEWCAGFAAFWKDI